MRRTAWFAAQGPTLPGARALTLGEGVALNAPGTQALLWAGLVLGRGGPVDKPFTAKPKRSPGETGESRRAALLATLISMKFSKRWCSRTTRLLITQQMAWAVVLAAHGMRSDHAAQLPKGEWIQV